MRSIQLKDLVSAEPLLNSQQTEENPESRGQSKQPVIATRPPIIWLKHELLNQYPIDDDLTNWPFTFRLRFVDRNLKLSARTQQEMDAWIQIFNEVNTKGKSGKADKSPKAAESQQDEDKEKPTFINQNITV